MNSPSRFTRQRNCTSPATVQTSAILWTSIRRLLREVLTYTQSTFVSDEVARVSVKFPSWALTQPTRTFRAKVQLESGKDHIFPSDLRILAIAIVLENKMAIGLKLFKGIAFTKALNNEEIILPGVFLCLPCNPLYFAYFHFFLFVFPSFLCGLARLDKSHRSL